MVCATVTVRNRAGIHVRPSGIIITEAKKIKGAISVKAKGFSTDLSNVMLLLAMGLETGDQVELAVNGKNEQSELAALVELFEREYDFPGK